MKHRPASRRYTSSKSTRRRRTAGIVEALEPVDELAVAHAPHLRERAGADDEAGERVVVRPVLPRLEVVRERERRAVAAVARLEGVPDAAVRLVLDLRGRLADLVREEVVVHRDRVEGVAGDRDLGERERPEPLLTPGPGAERRRAARVVAEAVPREHRVEDAQVALEAR